MIVRGICALFICKYDKAPLHTHTHTQIKLEKISDIVAVSNNIEWFHKHTTDNGAKI